MNIPEDGMNEEVEFPSSNPEDPKKEYGEPPYMSQGHWESDFEGFVPEDFIDEDEDKW